MYILLQNQFNHFLEFYTGGDPRLSWLLSAWLTIMISKAILCFIVSEITGNYSQVDKIWSIMPIVYSFITLINFPSFYERIMLMTVLVSLWGVRLSFNFYRKGGYSFIPWKGEEDYRWTKLRQHPVLQRGVNFSLFNLLFISFYQQFLIMLFCTPLLLAAKYENVDLNAVDYVGAILMSLFILTETIADNQLHYFHQEKKKEVPESGNYTNSLAKGFVHEGLWKYVRHPNYISEQLIWVSFYLFGVAASGSWFNWTLTGPILLILLFVGSSGFTEHINLGKYPDYEKYKQQVPRFIPLIFKTKQQQKSNF
jgi:steroid 5-alpha reductase family enzyme